LKTLKGKVNQPTRVTFMPQGIQETPPPLPPKKGGIETPLATDSTRLAVKFLPP